VPDGRCQLRELCRVFATGADFELPPLSRATSQMMKPAATAITIASEVL